MIDQKNTLIGTVLAVVLVFVLGMVIPLVGGIVALIIAGIFVGYQVNSTLKIGALHGALIGLFTGIIYILIIYAVTGFSQKMIGGLIIYSLGSIPVYILIGLGGGIIGSVIKSRQNPGQVPEGEDEIIVDDEKDK